MYQRYRKSEAKQAKGNQHHRKKIIEAISGEISASNSVNERKEDNNPKIWRGISRREYIEEN